MWVKKEQGEAVEDQKEVCAQRKPSGFVPTAHEPNVIKPPKNLDHKEVGLQTEPSDFLTAAPDPNAIKPQEVLEPMYLPLSLANQPSDTISKISDCPLLPKLTDLQHVSYASTASPWSLPPPKLTSYASTASNWSECDKATLHLEDRRGRSTSRRRTPSLPPNRFAADQGFEPAAAVLQDAYPLAADSCWYRGWPQPYQHFAEQQDPYGMGTIYGPMIQPDYWGMGLHGHGAPGGSWSSSRQSAYPAWQCSPRAHRGRRGGAGAGAGSGCDASPSGSVDGAGGSLNPEQAAERRRRVRRRSQSRVRNRAALSIAAALNGFDSARCDELKQWIEKGGESRDEALAYLKGKVWPASCDEKGCRIVQLAINKAGVKDQDTIARELHTHVWEAVSSPHANHVLQQAIEQMPKDIARFIVEECIGRGRDVARHRYGCRIMCRILEFFPGEERKIALVDEVLVDIGSLCCHSFGHHVVQAIMEKGTTEQIKKVADAVAADLHKMVNNRHASYVVEGAFKNCAEEDKNGFVQQLLNDKSIIDMATNQFGSFVVKVLLNEKVVGTGTPQVVRDCLERHKDSLKENKYGLKMLQDVFGPPDEAEERSKHAALAADAAQEWRGGDQRTLE